MNFLIGGNTLGRGIAIRDLLVTYYIREAKVSQMIPCINTAIYGYRSVTMSIPGNLFPDTLLSISRYYRSDKDLRAYIEKSQSMPATFPVNTLAAFVPATGVLDVKKIDMLVLGSSSILTAWSCRKTPQAT